MAESLHRGAAAVVDAAGAVVLRIGDIEQPIYPRSAIKPLQALVAVESGAAAFELGDAEIALACASHSGEPRHVAVLSSWLARIGSGIDSLECGVHAPLDEIAALAIRRAGKSPTAAHNNCSGKHAGFITAARHLGHQVSGYVAYDHPVQQRLLSILEPMTGLDLGGAPRGVDGCGIPVIGIPLHNIALAMARLADPRDQPEWLAGAAGRIHRAMAAEPFMAAGSGRFDTRVIAETGGRALVKGGAEGVHCAALPSLGLGIALKIDDGATRASEVVMGLLLRHLGALTDDHSRHLSDLLEPVIRNRAGASVGCIVPGADWHL
jgi:L-asparaginase II